MCSLLSSLRREILFSCCLPGTGEEDSFSRVLYVRKTLSPAHDNNFRDDAPPLLLNMPHPRSSEGSGFPIAHVQVCLANNQQECRATKTVMLLFHVS